MRRNHRLSVFALLLVGAASAQANSSLHWPAQYGVPPVQYGAPPAYAYPPGQAYPPAAVVIVPQQSGPPYPEPRFRSPYNDVDRPWVRQQQEREYQWRLQQEQIHRNQFGGQNAWGRR